MFTKEAYELCTIINNSTTVQDFDEELQSRPRYKFLDYGRLGWTPLCCAARFSNIKLVLHIINLISQEKKEDRIKIINFESEHGSALDFAFYNSDIDMVEVLVRAGAILKSTLYKKIEQNDSRMIRYLIINKIQSNEEIKEIIEKEDNLLRIIMHNMLPISLVRIINNFSY